MILLNYDEGINVENIDHSYGGRSTMIRQAYVPILLCLGFLTLLSPRAIAKERHDGSLRGRVQALVNAYERDDSAGVLRIVDLQGFSIYGSDASELISTPAQLITMMENDFKLWHTAKFGAMRDVAIKVYGNFGSVFFQIPFSAGGSPDVLVRFATVWRRVNGVWLLTMSSNSVPTVGSSAAEILKANTP